MAQCNYDNLGTQSFFNGAQIAPGMPPPLVTLTEDVDSGSCSGYDARKSVNIRVEGELVCCDSDQKISVREALLSQFSNSCGNFSAGGNSYDDAKVQGIDISQSHYRDNVSYSISLLWVDPSYPNAVIAKISNPSSVISADEDDQKVTIKHSVSAQAAENVACGDCACDIGPVKAWVSGEISQSAPSPNSIQLPQNRGGDTLNCSDISEEVNLGDCSYSITKTWVIAKKPVSVEDNDGNDNITATRCHTVSYDRNQKKTDSYTGTITYVGASVSCDDPNDPKFMTEVEDVLNAEIARISGKGKVTSKSITKSEPASANYSIEFAPDPDSDIRGKTLDEYNISTSFGTDGIITVTVSGSLKANQNYPYSTVSRNCKCEAVEKAWEEGKYKGIADKAYNEIKEYLNDDIIMKLVGPCFDIAGALNPEATSESIKEGKQDCSKNYSFTWDNRKQIDAEWDYSVTINRPIEQVSIKPLLNGGFCVIEGDEDEGTISVNGRRSQDCPDDPEWDKDQVALEIAQGFLPEEDLEEDQEGCVTTIETPVGPKTSEFSKSFTYGGNVNPSINAPTNKKKILIKGGI